MTINLVDIVKVLINSTSPLRYLIVIGLSFLINSVAFSAETEADSPTGNIHIRTLAASCAACHGNNGNSVAITPSLAGLSAQYFSAQMLAFKQGKRQSTVMHQHAAGLTDLEIEQLAHYFALQKKIKSLPPPSRPFDNAGESSFIQ